jgi:Family of unknown function (DUF5681)
MSDDIIEPSPVPPVEDSGSPPVEASSASPPVETLPSPPTEALASVQARAENIPETTSPVLAPSGLNDQACTDPPASLRANGEGEIHKPRGRPFEPGRSGNPNGRPKGSRNHITRAVEELINDQAEELVAKAIEKALAGDSSMLRVLLIRIVPPQRARTVELELPDIKTLADAPAASAAVLAACSGGKISPAEAEVFMAIIAMQVSIIEKTDLEARLIVVEKEEQK